MHDNSPERALHDPPRYVIHTSSLEDSHNGLRIHKCRHSSGEIAAAEATSGSGEARIRALQLRVQAAEASAERANDELLKACTRAEAAQTDARKYHATLKEMQACALLMSQSPQRPTGKEAGCIMKPAVSHGFSISSTFCNDIFHVGDAAARGAAQRGAGNSGRAK